MLKTIRVATWNIAGGRQIKSLDLFDYESENIEYFSKELEKVNPDVVCIQEDHIRERKSVARQIANLIGFKNFCVVSMSPSHIDKECFLGMAVLSKNKFRNCKSICLPYPEFKLLWKDGSEANKHHKYLQITNVDGLWIINFFTLPIQLWGYDYDRDVGKDYALKIEELLLNLKKPLIICGDFNHNEPIKIYPKFATEYKLTDALPKMITRPTLNGNFENPDHILYSDEFRCLEAKVVKTNTDHYLCVAELEF